jgi:hypothetical protein
MCECVVNAVIRYCARSIHAVFSAMLAALTALIGTVSIYDTIVYFGNNLFHEKTSCHMMQL